MLRKLRSRKQRLLQTLLTNLFIYLEPLTQLVKEQLATACRVLTTGNWNEFPAKRG